MVNVKALAPAVGVRAACEALGLPRSSFYRAAQPPETQPTAQHPTPPRALSPAEKEQVRAVLNSPRFQDQAPREVYATLLEEGLYVCHWRSMYRILDEDDEVRERRNQLSHPAAVKPHLVATAPNQLWSWDITKLLGPAKRLYYYLYVIVDVYSRYVPGWLLAESESAELAEELIAMTCAQQGIGREQLTLHADNGAPMIAKPLSQLFTDLDITPSHSRPHVPDDNPPALAGWPGFSEAQFKTLKYRPDYPERFGSEPEAHQWAQGFFHWYNYEHHHSALALLTPAVVHSGQAPAVLAERQRVLMAAYAAHPERFVKGPPTPGVLPQEVWINRPQPVLELPEVAH